MHTHAMSTGDRPMTEMGRSYVLVLVSWVLVLVGLYALQAYFS